MSIHITDSELFTLLGFTTDREQALLRAFMEEKGFKRGKNLVAWCVRHTHSAHHPTPDLNLPRGLPALD